MCLSAVSSAFKAVLLRSLARELTAGFLTLHHVVILSVNVCYVRFLYLIHSRDDRLCSP